MQFKVGQIVKVTDDGFYKGHTGVIKRVDHHDMYPYLVCFEEKKDCRFDGTQLEEVEVTASLEELHSSMVDLYKGTKHAKGVETDVKTVTQDICDLPKIVESGESRQFSTGAKRDSATGKGRPLLISPLAKIDLLEDVMEQIKQDNFSRMEWNIWKYVVTRERGYLRRAVNSAYDELNNNCERNADIVLAKLMEAGAEKKGERNWEKGMPVSVYLESALRHMWKWEQCEDDEDHAAAFLFNMYGAIHTLIELGRGNYPQELAPDWPNYNEEGKVSAISVAGQYDWTKNNGIGVMQ